MKKSLRDIFLFCNMVPRTEKGHHCGDLIFRPKRGNFDEHLGIYKHFLILPLEKSTLLGVLSPKRHYRHGSANTSKSLEREVRQRQPARIEGGSYINPHSVSDIRSTQGDENGVPAPIFIRGKGALCLNKPSI